MRKFACAFLAAGMLALAFGLTACVVEEVPEDTPELPDDPGGSGKESIAGIDADADGVRDDVQIYVHANYPDPGDRAAAIQLVKALQQLVTTGGTESKALAAGAAMNKAIDCLYSRDAEKFGDRVEAIEGSIVNTGARAQAYARAGAFLSGANFSVSTVADNAASCEEDP
jgi:hypothetical protein